MHLDIPDNPSKPCLSCTKQWCLNQNLPICAGALLGDTDPDTATGKEGDVEARCFRELFSLLALLNANLTSHILCLPFLERDSPRDQLVVTLFLLTVFGLLLGAGIKGRMEKAGFDTGIPWSTGRRWWEVSILPFRSAAVLHLLSMVAYRNGCLDGNLRILVCMIALSATQKRETAEGGTTLVYQSLLDLNYVLGYLP